MDGDGLNEEAFEREVRTWVRANWDPAANLTEWRTLLANSGWGCPSWPRKWFGKDAPLKMDVVAKRVLVEEGAVGVAAWVSMYLVAQTLLELSLIHISEPPSPRYMSYALGGVDE